MLDFFIISTRPSKRGTIEIYPKFVVKKSNDLMIRGGDFYAIWVEERGLWSTNEQDAIDLIDRELDRFAKENRDKFDAHIKVLHLWDSENGMIDRWHKYCQKHMRDDFHMLDEKLVFSNTETDKKDFASKRLSYPLESGEIPAYNKLMSTLYSEDERQKIEWAIGSIVSGDSKHIQKFMVLYGSAGTGKSTILNIVQQLFEGYYSVFDAKALGSSSNQFALEAFKTNPLVAIQHDGDLSKIEDNTRLNSLVSHEMMTINEKFKATYSNRFKCFLFMGTNKPVKITDAKSGLIRRLIDVTPSGNKVDQKEYRKLVKQVSFELGAIASHCLDVYLDNPGRYDDYIPFAMMGASNDFYNFIIDSYHIFKKEDGTTLKASWEMYKNYCEETKVPYPYSQMRFKEELKNYFWEYSDRFNLSDGSRVRSYYSGFRTDKFETEKPSGEKKESKTKYIEFDSDTSIFDKECADCLAQYATAKETPSQKWDEVYSTLSEIDTSKLHYVKVPENHIVIDFDIPDENGNKSFKRNLEEASKWPATYAELSKSGQGIHLHYIYTGDASRLSMVYADHIEIKAFPGKSSLRRKLTKCNNLPIATISSGLPLKGEKKLVNSESVKSEKGLRSLIKRNLNKEIHHATKPSIDFIYEILENAYADGLNYDVSDMYNEILAFAASSTNQADYCIKLVGKMHFKSDDPSVNPDSDSDDIPIVFYDVEVFPNLFLVNWKYQGEDKKVVRMINPSPMEIEKLMRYRLIGFNCRRYDNHILYARLMGYNNMQLYNLSQRIINGDKNAMFGEAYNVSYTDIYDFTVEKKSLKKWEIELGIHHQELGLPWDQPVPEGLWDKVAEYCDNDVIATEAVFNARQADFMARKIQVDLVKSMYDMTDVSVNDTTNALSGKIIFGRERKPQSQFNYRDLSKPVGSDQYEDYRRMFGEDYIFRVWDDNGLPLYRDYIPGEKLPDRYSILPFFKGYKYERGVSTFMGDTIGEGGRVYSEPGMYANVWDGDVASMHPHSAIFECLFGPKYTKIFQDIVNARVAIKHKDFEAASKMLDGALVPYLKDEYAADLAQALKIVINSIYGLTSAAYENQFRDSRNIDNIVAKRGALFMTLLKNEVQKRGYTVAHIKTDSIKIPDADEEIMDFIIKFGKEYGYSFETEATFSKFCLVNDAVYIAKHKGGDWTATGAQFAVPYVFKKLFSKEDICFEDLCETKSVSTSLYLDLNETLPDVSIFESIQTIRDKVNFDKNVELSKKDNSLLQNHNHISDEELEKLIAEGHDYKFVGKVGLFCPIKEGCGGGILSRESKNKYGRTMYNAATGSKGYRWLESEFVKTMGKEEDIDKSYYNAMVDKAIETISEFGDFEQFVSDDSNEIGEFERVAPDGTLEKDPFTDTPWKVACGKDTCFGCPHLYKDQFHIDCELGHDISDYILAVQMQNNNKKEK